MNLGRLHEKLEAFKTEQLQRLQPIGTWPPVLYHVTSSDALCSILSSGKFRASAIHRLNDSVEMRFAVSAFQAHLKKFIAQETEALVRFFFQKMRDQLANFSFDGFYVASFTEDGDRLDMWEQYGSRGTGFSLAFPLHMVADWNCFPGKCHYGSDRLNDLCEGFLVTLRAALADEADLIDEEEQSIGAFDFDLLAGEVLWNASYLALLFKMDAWSDENEWRLIFANGLLTRSGYSSAIRYVEFPVSENFPVEAVCAGPNCPEQSKQRVANQICASGRSISLFSSQFLKS